MEVKHEYIRRAKVWLENEGQGSKLSPNQEGEGKDGLATILVDGEGFTLNARENAYDGRRVGGVCPH